MRTVKTAVVGLHRGRTLADFILKYSHNIELVAVSDLERSLADEYAKENNIPAVYDCLDDVLKTDAEAVILATPIPDHEEHVVKCLKAGKHVLSEVISATTIEGCQRIADAIKETGKKYMMEENYCFYRPLTIVKNMVDSGLLGDMYYGESDYLMDFEQRSGFPQSLQQWRKDTYFGRRGHPYITHTLGPLLHIMNEKVKTVTAMAAGRNFDMVADNTCTLILETEKGHLIRLRSSFVSPRPDNVTYYSFQGTDGCYQAPQGPTDFHKVFINGECERGGWNNPGGWKNVYEFKDYTNDEWKKYWNIADYENAPDNDTYELYDSGALLMLEKFADCLLNNKPAPISFADAANWTAAGLISADSINAGCKPHSVPTFE